MKRQKLNILTLLILSFVTARTVQAQTALPYFSGFDNATQKNGWQLIRKGVNGAYQWSYENEGPFSGTQCLYHGYPVGGTAMTDDWFVSPAFNFAGGGKLDSIRHSFSGFGTPDTQDTLAIYLLTGNPDPALATTRVLLSDFRGGLYHNDATWRLTSNINIPATPGSVYLAIRYKTVNNWFDVKFDNVRLSANKTTAIHQPAVYIPMLKVFPNPAGEDLFLTSEESFTEIFITDLSGRLWYQKPFSKKVDLSLLQRGVYVLTGISSSGQRVNRSFVKQ